MLRRDTYRYLFPAVFAVLAIAGLIATSAIQAGMLGTRGDEPINHPALIGVAGPQAAPVAVASPEAANVTGPGAPQTAPAAVKPGTNPVTGPGAPAVPGGNTEVIVAQPYDHFPWGLFVAVSIFLSALFVLLWLFVDTAVKNQRRAATAPHPPTAAVRA